MTGVLIKMGNLDPKTDMHRLKENEVKKHNEKTSQGERPGTDLCSHLHKQPALLTF